MAFWVDHPYFQVAVPQLLQALPVRFRAEDLNESECYITFFHIFITLCYCAGGVFML